MKGSQRLHYWFIIDSLVGSGEHLLEQYWHFAPGLAVKLSDKIPAEAPVGMSNPEMWLRGAEEYRLEFIADEIIVATLCDIRDIGGNRASGQRVQAELFMGWDSPYYGLKIPSSVARIAMRTQLPIDVVTVLFPVRDSQMPLVRLGKGNGPSVAALAGTGREVENRYDVLVGKAKSSTGNYEVRVTCDDIQGMERQDGGKRYWVEIDGLCDRFVMPDPEEIWAWRQAGSG